MIATLVQLVGFALLTIAGFLVAPALGFFVAGLLLAVTGHALDVPTAKPAKGDG